MAESLDIDASTRAKVISAAESMGISVDELVRRAITLYEDTRRPETGDEKTSLADQLESAGLLGVYKDLPKDLSTNPKHMDGFGDA